MTWLNHLKSENVKKCIRMGIKFFLQWPFGEVNRLFYGYDSANALS